MIVEVLGVCLFILVSYTIYSEKDKETLKKKRDYLIESRDEFIKDSNTMLSDLDKEQAEEELAGVIDIYQEKKLEFSKDISNLLEAFSSKEGVLNNKIKAKYDMLADNLSEDLKSVAKEDIAKLKEEVEKLYYESHEDLIEKLEGLEYAIDKLDTELKFLSKYSVIKQQAVLKNSELIEEFIKVYNDVLEAPLLNNKNFPTELHDRMSVNLEKLGELSSVLKEEVEYIEEEKRRAEEEAEKLRLEEEKRKEEAEQKRLEKEAKEKPEQERLDKEAQEKAEQERLDKEKEAQEKAEQERLEKQKKAQEEAKEDLKEEVKNEEKAEQERLDKEKEAQEKAKEDLKEEVKNEEKGEGEDGANKKPLNPEELHNLQGDESVGKEKEQGQEEINLPDTTIPQGGTPEEIKPEDVENNPAV